jgi:histidinol dehydrogenase
MDLTGTLKTMITIIENREEIDHFIKKSQLQNQQPADRDILETLKQIQHNVRTQKIAAVLDYTKQFDQVELTVPQLKVTPAEISEAHQFISEPLMTALTTAKTNIETFHQRQFPQNWEASPQDGVTYGMRYRPIERVCLYVPGGRAPYPSTVLMDAIPAKIAGVKKLMITTPPRKDGTIAPEILVAAELCGVTDIYKVGGAQAIFAVTYGTESMPTVDKIVGPGNIYVNLAKQMVYGQVDIDKPAGPSDVLVVIEDPQYAPYAAAEMLAQLEHDPLSTAITISTHKETLVAIQNELQNQIKTLSRNAIINDSIKNSELLLATDQSSLITLINQIAAEHVVLLIDEYHSIQEQIQNGGSIFCGPYTPVTLGDYYAGPNHVLPTGGTSRFASPLNVMDFMKFSTHLHYTKAALHAANPHLKELTEMEGFSAHYNAVDQRFRQYPI